LPENTCFSVEPQVKSVSHPFDEIDRADFWKMHESHERDYTDSPLTTEMVEAVERELGYTLPEGYIALMKRKNGGVPVKSFHRMKEPTSWATGHIAITGIFSIGRVKPCSLLGEQGSAFWVEVCGYPAIGVYFADCPSAGHDMLCLDYRECGTDGEPAVVHVDQELEYKITLVAPNFESFICGLERDEATV
jgi:hypothetical protein